MRGEIAFRQWLTTTARSPRLLVASLLGALMAGTGFGQSRDDWSSELASAKDILALAKLVPASLKEPGAILLDRGVEIYERNGHSYSIEQYAAKLLDEKATDKGWGEESVNYNTFYEKLVYYKAETILPDGKVVPVPEKTYIKTKTEHGEGSVSFSFPQAEKGSIVHYVSVIEHVRDIMPGHYSGEWWYWTGKPVIKCDFTLDYPTKDPLPYRHVNGEPKETTTLLNGGARTRKHWEYSHPEAMEYEWQMPPADEVEPRTEFSTTANWSDIGKWYCGLTTPLAHMGPDAKKAITTAVGNAADPKAKATAIWKWVTDNLRYVAIPLGESTHKPAAPDDVFAKRFGDCKDQSLFLLTALKGFGISSNLVLLNAGDTTRFDKKLPSVNEFDHCIVLADVGGKQLWLDPAAGKAPFGLLPDSVRDVQVLLVKETGGEIAVGPKHDAWEPGSTSSEMHISIQPDGGADVSLSSDIAPRAVQQIDDMKTEKEKKEYDDMCKGGLEGVFPTTKDVKVEVKRPTNGDPGPCKMVISGHATKVGERIADLLLLDAISIKEVDTEIKMDRYVGQNQKRDYPFVFEEGDPREGVVEVKFPSGWSVAENFKSYHMRGPGVDMTRTVTVEGNTLRIVVRSQPIKERFPATDLDKMIQFKKEQDKANAGRVVLRVPGSP